MKITAKILVAVFALLLFIACSKDEEVSTTNNPPNEFTVKVEPTGTTAIIKWNEAIDPDEDEVTYSVFLNNEKMAESLAKTDYSFKELTYETEYTGKVIAIDANGASSEATFTFTTTNEPNNSPSIVNLKSPATNAQNLALNPTLTWSTATDNDGDVIKYTIFLDKKENPAKVLKSNAEGTSFKVVDNLEYETTYYWKVEANDGKGGSSISKIGSFKTKKNTASSSKAPFGDAGEHTKVELGVYTNPYGYYEYLPKDFTTSGKKFPLLLSLHGIGKKGNGTTDLPKILENGPPRLIEDGKHFEAIVISPQSLYGWFGPDNFKALYNYIITNYPIDKDRVYVTGTSAGGGSTWKALSSHHDKIAAAIPICGANNLPDPAAFLQNTPIWAFHNFTDKIVGRGQTIVNVNRIANNGKSVMDVYPYSSGNKAAAHHYTMVFNKTTKKWTALQGVKKPTNKLAFTLYKDSGHDSWTKAYNNQEVWNWLFAQKLSNNKP